MSFIRSTIRNMAKLPIAGAHTFMATNGLTFNYAVQGTGPLVVFQSTGWGPSVDLYKNSFGRLETDFTILYLNARGAGGSSRASPDQMSTTDMASDLELLRSYLGVDKLKLIGHSNGGAIALAYAEEYPDSVEKLVLIDSELQGFTSDNFMNYVRARQGHPIYGPALQALMEAQQNPPKSDEEFADIVRKTAPYYFKDTDQVHLFLDALGNGSVSLFNFDNQKRCDAIEKFNAVKGLGKVKAKTLVINGDDDAMCSMDAARKVSGSILDARLEFVENAGHLPWLEQPDQFFSIVKRFLEE